MSKSEGILYVCDRCGATEFTKKIGEKVLDGGYTRYDEHEKLEGWLHEMEFGNLCPACADEFKRFVTGFMDGKVAPCWKYEPTVMEG